MNVCQSVTLAGLFTLVDGYLLAALFTCYRSRSPTACRHILGITTDQYEGCFKGAFLTQFYRDFFKASILFLFDTNFKDLLTRSYNARISWKNKIY